jgi:hypothetical protein
MIGHRVMGASLMLTGNIAHGRRHLDEAMALYNRAEHLPLATRFGHDAGVGTLCHRALCQWMLGYADSALADADRSIKDAREVGQASALMMGLCITSVTHILCGNRSAVDAQSDEAISLASEKGTLIWNGFGMINKGCASALGGDTADAVHMMNSGIRAWRSTGSSAGCLGIFRIWALRMRSFTDLMMLGAALARQ